MEPVWVGRLCTTSHSPPGKSRRLSVVGVQLKPLWPIAPRMGPYLLTTRAVPYTKNQQRRTGMPGTHRLLRRWSSTILDLLQMLPHPLQNLLPLRIAELLPQFFEGEVHHIVMMEFFRRDVTA